MKRLVLLVAVLAAVAPPAALAKEIAEMRICGPTACTTIDDAETLRNLPAGGEAVGTVPPVAPYYTVRITTEIPEEEGGPRTEAWELFYVPSAQLFAAADEIGQTAWLEMGGAPAALLKRIASRVEPFAAPEVTSAKVGDAVVGGDVSTYAQLLSLPGSGPGAGPASEWVPVDLGSERPTPWTRSDWDLAFSESSGVLQRGAEYVELTPAVADDLAAARPLGGDGRDWLPWLVLAAVGAALAALALLGRRLPPARAEARIPDEPATAS
jgi:hypothetical protein